MKHSSIHALAVGALSILTLALTGAFFHAHAQSEDRELVTDQVAMLSTRRPDSELLSSLPVPVGLQQSQGPVLSSREKTDHPKFLTLPFPNVGVYITQGWVCHFDPSFCNYYYNGGIHGAIDYARSSGGTIVSFDLLAAASGSATCYPEGSWEAFRGYGNMVWITHDGIGSGYSTIYGHLPGCEFTTKYVTQGERIGSAGTTGASTGIHLHFEARLGNSRIDPYDLYSTVSNYPQPGGTTPGAGANHIWTTNPPSFYGSGCCGCTVGRAVAGGSLLGGELIGPPSPQEAVASDLPAVATSVPEFTLKPGNSTPDATSVWPRLAWPTATSEATLSGPAEIESTPVPVAVRADLNTAPPSSANYRLARSVMSMGGGTKTSSSYVLRGTSGQPFATGLRTSSNYRLNSGYWGTFNSTLPPIGTPTPTATPIPEFDYNLNLPVVINGN